MINFFLLFSIFAAGCSSPEKVKNAQIFFTAFNHLLESSTLEAEGYFSAGKIASDYTFYLDQADPDPSLQLALILGDISKEKDNIQFYIKDGRTYLDYTGQTSQSLAENIGIQKGDRLDLYNPFLDLSDAQRADFFDSITVDAKTGTWTFELDPVNVGLLLDQLGSAQISNAVMTVVFDSDQEIQKLNLDITGTIVMGVSSADLSIAFEMNVLKRNQPVTIPWPDNLADYGKNSSSTDRNDTSSSFPEDLIQPDQNDQKD